MRIMLRGERVDGAALILLVVVVHELDGDLGIRLGLEAIAVLLQLLAQLLMVLDDAVVHRDDRHVVAAVRVRVALRGLAVRGPARCGRCRRCPGACGRRRSSSASADRRPLALTTSIPAVALAHGQSCGVIPAVFQALEAIHQNRRRLLASHISNNSAHARFYSFSFISLKEILAVDSHLVHLSGTPPERRGRSSPGKVMPYQTSGVSSTRTDTAPARIRSSIAVAGHTPRGAGSFPGSESPCKKRAKSRLDAAQRPLRQSPEVHGDEGLRVEPPAAGDGAVRCILDGIGLLHAREHSPLVDMAEPARHRPVSLSVLPRRNPTRASISPPERMGFVPAGKSCASREAPSFHSSRPR